MTIVVDTSILIDHLRGDERALALFRSAAQSGERMTASVLTKTEILAGMRPSEESITRAIFGSLEWIEVNDPLAERAGNLANQFMRSHSGIDPVDYIIAATVEQLRANLWTLNVRDFPMFPGLRPPY